MFSCGIIKIEKRAKKMFRSIFAKYIAVFALIIFVCFAMLTAITAGTVNNYAETAKADLVNRAASALNGHLYQKVASYDGLSDYVKNDSGTLDAVLHTVASSSQDLMLILADYDGRVLIVATAEGIVEPSGLIIPERTVNDLRRGEKITSIEAIDGLFSSPCIAGAELITAADGDYCGGAYVCAGVDTMSELSNAITKTIFLSSLCVMLAALIAVYFITERVIAPLRAMSRAAKSLAAGDFSVQVPVKGQDEIADLAVAFNNMASSLEASEKMRNSFMANVSHDLRTPMTTIAGFIDGILDGVIPPERYEHYLNIISTEVHRLSRLVSQLLDISRIQAGDRRFNMQPFDVCEMGRQILISFEQKIDAKRLEVEFDADDDNIYAMADRDAIYQIMYNICDNAVKFSSEGGRLSIGIKYAEKHKINVSVFNEGQGIKAEDLPYVFERFYKGDKSRGLDKSGVGLGMFISKTIMDAHNEQIGVESEYGKYCRFSFTLARAKENDQ